MSGISYKDTLSGSSCQSGVETIVAQARLNLSAMISDMRARGIPIEPLATGSNVIGLATKIAQALLMLYGPSALTTEWTTVIGDPSRVTQPTIDDEAHVVTMLLVMASRNSQARIRFANGGFANLQPMEIDDNAEMKCLSISDGTGKIVLAGLAAAAAWWFLG